MWIIPDLSRVCPKTLNIPSRFSISGGFNSGTIKKATSANLSYGKHTHIIYIYTYIYIYLSIHSSGGQFNTWDADRSSPSHHGQASPGSLRIASNSALKTGCICSNQRPSGKALVSHTGKEGLPAKMMPGTGKAKGFQRPYSTRNVGAMNYPQLQVRDDSIWFIMIQYEIWFIMIQYNLIWFNMIQCTTAVSADCDGSLFGFTPGTPGAMMVDHQKYRLYQGAIEIDMRRALPHISGHTSGRPPETLAMDYPLVNQHSNWKWP